MSILRTSKFVKYIGSLARNIVINSTRNVDGLLIKRHGLNFSPNYATAAAVSQQNDSIDRSIKRLDEDARRIGRISRRELEDVIEEIKLSKSATSSQSLMVIRCCGNLVPEETPEFRTKLVNNVWDILQKLGVPMDISHYNALLRVYLENEHQFSPTEFLSELERKGIEPNRVTYQRLIAGYCQKGDIDGATQILEFMKEKQMPISEAVFNALILGHSKAGDLQSARGILGVMGQAGLEPNADTYSALLCGYASAGDAASIEAIFEECEQKEIYLADRDYLEIVFTLALNNHDSLVDSVLKKINHAFGYNQDASNIVLRLTTNGKENIALKVLETMQAPVKHDGQVAPSGGFFIRQLVKSNRPVKNILDICDHLKDNGLNSRGLLIATEVALQSGNADLALDLFKAMRENLYPIRNHFFWPLIVSKGQKDGKAVLEVLKKMTEFKVIPNSETLQDYIIPYMVPGDHVDNVDKLIGELQSSGTSLGSAAASLVGYLLSKNNLQQAAEVASSFQANYSTASRRNLVSAFLLTNDSTSFAKLLNAIVQGRRNQRTGEQEEEVVGEDEFGFDEREFIGRILLSVVGKSKSINLTDLLQKLIANGLGISNSTAEQIQLQLSGTDLTTEVSDLLSQLVSPDLTPVPLQRRSVRGSQPRSEETIRNSIEKLKAKGDPAGNQKRVLFNLLCQSRNVDKVVAYCKELEAEGYVFTSGMYALLIELYLYHNDLDSALKEYNILLEKEPDIKLDNIKTIKLATGLVNSGRINDAIDLLKKQSREQNAFEVESEKEKPFFYTSACWRIMNSVAEKGDTEGVKKLFDALVENKFIEPNNAMLGPLVKAYIVKDDLKGALEVYEWCCQHFRATPFKNELACKLIQKEDAVELQRLTDLSTFVHGEINSLHDLIISFVECGRIRQARKILETPGLRVRSDKLSHAGERYQTEGLVEPLEALLKATKDISQVDRSGLYYQLLLSYIRAEDVTKALGLWTQMQEEDVQASDEFLHDLGKFLESKEKPVPFVIPEVSLERAPGENSNFGLHQQLQKSIKNKMFGEAMKAYESLKNAHSKLYPSEISNLLELVMNTVGAKEALPLVKEWLGNGTVIPRYKLHYFIKKLAKTGDTKAFDELGDLLSDEQKKVTQYRNLYFNCMLENCNPGELLDNVEKKLLTVTSAADIVNTIIPNGGLLGLLSAAPDLASRVEKIAEKHANYGVLGTANMLWAHYVKTSNDVKADEIFDKYLKTSPRLLFRNVQQEIRKNSDETRCDKLLGYVRKWENATTRNIGLVHSSKLDILSNKGESEQALAYLKEALKEVTINELNYTALNRLKVLCDSKNVEFPYSISRKKVQQEAEDASSDSDNEVASHKKVK